MAPCPGPQLSADGPVDPVETPFSAFVFKIQANMDPKHRDRIAFVRLCSGHFRRGMKMHHPRSGKTMNIHTPLMFMAQDRDITEDGWPGDIIGIPNRGALAIGDALTEGEVLQFKGIPSFAPEMFRRVILKTPLKAKALAKGLRQLSEEGAIQVFKPMLGATWVVGADGIRSSSPSP